METLFIIDTTHGEIYYSISYMAAILIAAAMGFYAGVRMGYPKFPWLLLMMAGGMFFIIGEKVATYSPGQWMQVFTDFQLPRTGKKTILGGILGLSAGLILGKTWFRFYRPVVDNFAIALPVAMAISRIGCLMAGCCFGTPANVPWGIHYGSSSIACHVHMMHGLLHPHDTASALIHPVQVYEILGCLLIAFLVWKTRNRWSASGSLFLFSVLCYAMLRFLVEFVRAPESSFVMAQDYSGLKTIQWVIMAVMVTGLIFLIGREKRQDHDLLIIKQMRMPASRQVVMVVFFTVVAYSGRNWFTPVEMSLILLFLLPVLVFTILRMSVIVTKDGIRLKLPGLQRDDESP